MRPEEPALRAKLAEIYWWHTIDLGGGLITPGRDNSPKKLQSLAIPDRLEGRTVLDMATWDGFFAFECEKRGAARVVATDHFAWHEGTGKAGFDLAVSLLGSKVEGIDMDVMSHSPESIGQFDLVLFLGALYHLEDPMGALRAVSSVTKDLLILETHVDMLFTRRPAAAFYPEDQLEGVSTNWFGPNPAAVEGMLRSVGFKKVEMVSHTSPSLRAVQFGRDLLGGRRSQAHLSRGRAVFHASK